MRYIDNYELREWVKESLKKSIFQKAHSLAVQTGCQILVKLEDENPIAGTPPSTQYYATEKMQRAYRRGCIVCRTKPGETCISGETGLPAPITVDTAVQSCETFAIESRGISRLSSVANVDQSISGMGLNADITGSSCVTQVHLNSARQSSNKPDTSMNLNDFEHRQFEDTPKHIISNSDSGVCKNVTEPMGDELNDLPMTEAPSFVKSEPQDDIKSDAVGKEDVDQVDYSADSLEESVAMEMVNTESEDFYDIDDYYGSGHIGDDDGNDMNQQQSLEYTMNTGMHHNSNVGLDGATAADINRIPTIASVNQNTSLSSATTLHNTPTSDTTRPVAMSQWTHARHSLLNGSGRMYKKAPSHQKSSISSKRKPMHLHQTAPPHNFTGKHALKTPEAVSEHMSYPVTLPCFSKHVTNALENGNVQRGKMWHMFCKETCQFYLPLLDFYDGSNVYQNIGRTMFERYPCIGVASGVRPWTSFNKYLSNKIRQARFQAKKKEQEQEQEF